MSTEELKEYGIEQLKAWVEGVIDASDTLDDILDDGKVNLDDLFKVLDINGIVAKFKDNPEALAELKDLTAVERVELEAHVVDYSKNKLSDDQQDKGTNIVVKLMRAALAVVDLISEF